jgi:hypothetical protein
MNIKLSVLLLMTLLALSLSACSDAVSSPTPIPTPTVVPTVVLTPTADPFLAGKIVQAYWDALPAGDLETALSYVHDHISCRGSCYLTGKPMFRSYLEGYIKSGYLTKISDVKNVGNLVTYAWDVYRNDLFVQSGADHETMELKDGLIIYWENYHR